MEADRGCVLSLVVPALHGWIVPGIRVRDEALPGAVGEAVGLQGQYGTAGHITDDGQRRASGGGVDLFRDLTHHAATVLGGHHRYHVPVTGIHRRRNGGDDHNHYNNNNNNNNNRNKFR